MDESHPLRARNLKECCERITNVLLAVALEAFRLRRRIADKIPKQAAPTQSRMA